MKEENEKVDKCLIYLYQEQDIQQEKEINKEKEINSDKELKIQLDNKYTEEIEEIIKYLNEKSNKKFTTNSKFVNDCIIELLEDSIEDFIND